MLEVQVRLQSTTGLKGGRAGGSRWRVCTPSSILHKCAIASAKRRRVGLEISQRRRRLPARFEFRHVPERQQCKELTRPSTMRQRPARSYQKVPLTASRRRPPQYCSHTATSSSSSSSTQLLIKEWLAKTISSCRCTHCTLPWPAGPLLLPRHETQARVLQLRQ